MKILEKAKALLESFPLCDHCLGRQFALLGYGMSNAERGRAVKLILTMEGDRLIKEEGKNRLLKAVAKNGLSDTARLTLQSRKIKVEDNKSECFICGNTFSKVDQLVDDALERLREYEYESFLVGVHVHSELENREDELRSRYETVWGESIRNEFSREIGKRIQAATNKTVDLHRPDILLIVDPFAGEISLEVNSLFLSGRYRKLVRNIPQSRWVCSKCQGRGCDRCGWMGRLYSESIEELIGAPIMAAAEGIDYRLHAAGREDIDTRTLGSGRPFVIEIFKPKRRKLNLEHLANIINSLAAGKIKVSELKFSSKKAVRMFKSAGQSTKIYRAVVEFGREVDESELKLLNETFSNKLLSQFTPTRVAHRRAPKIRKKYIYEVEARSLQPKRAELLIRCQGGLYVKEFISGDEGRTKPSVAEVLNTEAKCVELDLLDVELKEERSGEV